MASCGDDCSVKVWSCGRASDGRQPNWAHVCTLSGYHERAVYSCHYSAGGLIASGSGDNSIRIFAVRLTRAVLVAMGSPRCS